MMKQLDHVGIVVKNTDNMLNACENVLGLKPAHTVVSDEHGLKITFIPVGNIEIEVIEPLRPYSALAALTGKQEEGIHHICFEVDDIDKELKELAAKGVGLIHKEAQSGMAGRIGFVDPKDTNGVLIELCQKT